MDMPVDRDSDTNRPRQVVSGKSGRRDKQRQRSESAHHGLQMLNEVDVSLYNERSGPLLS